MDEDCRRAIKSKVRPDPSRGPNSLDLSPDKGVAGMLRNGGRFGSEWVADLVRKTHRENAGRIWTRFNNRKP